ncbi:disulfide bond formation protein DsbA [Longibacter salinarum]|uniref:Disulfide bond formation protein DsbA n=1 Tax=Longibacter salinarum TaxID=1850348 RepID=A0A2A8CUR3_9BACT|nr:DsbA family oxidoreductase [Longibacter salinarum]PEN11487.1 disulfide bond formation protein DsbA [Longibacter salinarum]
MADDATPPLIIDVHADIACPWCYIGHQRLEQALEKRPELDVVLRWRPFQLQPGMPAEGRPWREFAQEKFGGWDKAQQMFERVKAVGSEDGLVFNFDSMEVAPNTADAHRLVLWAEGQSAGVEMSERLYAAYFADGKNVSDRNVLARCAADAGLDPDAAREMLQSEDWKQEVVRAQDLARQRGVTGVPFHVFDERYAVSGAQPVEAFVRALDTATGG